ncbi:MAG: hypothetical protein AB7V00_03435 [Bacilli bacterium]
MKKGLLFLLFIFTLFMSGCSGNQVSPNEGEIIFYFPNEYLLYTPYEEIPDYHFTFTGIVNTIDAATTTNKKVFGKNDDFIISSLLASLFSQYESENRLETRLLLTQTAFETRMNTLETNDEGEKYQKSYILKVEDGIIYEEIAYLLLENGLTLTFEYRRFATKIDEVVTMMYCWKYTTPLNAVLHYPVIINVLDNQTKELLIVPLPLKSVYRMGLNDKIPLKTFFEEDEFLDPIYSSFYYPDFNDDPRANELFDLQANIDKVKQYYVTYHQGQIIDEHFVFTYLGKTFQITFNDLSFSIALYEIVA